MKHGWFKARMKVDFLSLPKGKTVAVARSKLVHTSIGVTYWIMSFDHDVIYHVSESYGGRNLRQMLVIERPVKDETLCRAEAYRLLATSQYGKAKRHEIKSLLSMGTGG
jgi:hypothetical protein